MLLISVVSSVIRFCWICILVVSSRSLSILRVLYLPTKNVKFSWIFSICCRLPFPFDNEVPEIKTKIWSARVLLKYHYICDLWLEHKLTTYFSNNYKELRNIGTTNFSVHNVFFEFCYYCTYSPGTTYIMLKVANILKSMMLFDIKCMMVLLLE